MAKLNMVMELRRTELCAKMLANRFLAIEAISAYVDRLSDDEVNELLIPTPSCSTCDAECGGHG